MHGCGMCALTAWALVIFISSSSWGMLTATPPGVAHMLVCCVEVLYLGQDRHMRVSVRGFHRKRSLWGKARKDLHRTRALETRVLTGQRPCYVLMMISQPQPMNP